MYKDGRECLDNDTIGQRLHEGVVALLVPSYCRRAIAQDADYE